MVMTCTSPRRRGRARQPRSARLERGVSGSALLLALVLPWSSAPATAQEAVVPGARMRIQAQADHVPSGRWTVGDLVSWDAASLTLDLDAGGRLSVENAAVRRVQLSQGTRRPMGRGAMIGALTLGTLVGTAAFLSELGCTEEPFDWWGCSNPARVGAVGFGAGAVLGAAAGAAVGALMPVERWQNVAAPIRVEAAHRPGGGVGIGVRVSAVDRP